MLRKGVTTGACAQAAAKGCALMLSQKRKIDWVEIELPNKEWKRLPLKKQNLTNESAFCCVTKDAGDDSSDVTDGIEICCEIKKTHQKGVHIQGGYGIGRVTKKGLPVTIGEYAINPVPKQMILRDVSAILSSKEGFSVEISVPNGKQIAKKTFNPKLGIQGGISILGTTGIVEPKSEEAYKVSLSLELNVARTEGYKTIFLVSGYIGEKLLKEKFKVDKEAIIKIGDHVGFMLKECIKKGISTVVLTGHIGKLSKVAAGLFNTHNRFGDARLETIAAYAASCGAKQEVVNQVLQLNLSEAAIDVLRKHNLMSTFDKIARRVVERADEYCQGRLRLAAILLSLKGEIVGMEPKDLIKGDIWEKFTLSVWGQGQKII